MSPRKLTHHIKTNLIVDFAILIIIVFAVPNNRALIASVINPDASTRAATTKIISVKDFGAVGDGVADDQQAMQDAATYLCAHPGYSLIYPPGTYRIAQYRITGGPNKNTVNSISYSNCNNVTISGYGATIDVFGGFRRTGDAGSIEKNGVTIFSSYENAVIPFAIGNSKNFIIKGFELNGNAQSATRDATVYEGANAAIYTSMSSNYLLKDLNIHHFLEDGIYLGAGGHSLADRNATLENLNVHNNARNGLSIIQARGVAIKNSTFTDNGRTGGSYGGHNPQAGVDVEPNNSTATGMDVNTGNLAFDGDTFSGNIGEQLVAGNANNTDTISVQNSTITPSADSATLAYYVVTNGLFQNNTFNLANNQFIKISNKFYEMTDPSWSAVYKNNTFNTSYNQLFPISSVPKFINNIRLTNNTFNFNSPNSDTSVFQVKSFAEFSNNSIHVSGSAFNSTKNDQSLVSFINVPNIHGNTYTTDLPEGKRYLIDYSTDSTAFSEIFSNANSFNSTNYVAAANPPAETSVTLNVPPPIPPIVDLPVVIPTISTPATSDTAIPTISIRGDNPTVLTIGDTFNDAGATAHDDADGDITTAITTTNSVDTSNPGTYSVTYQVKDAAQNAASAIRTVIVNSLPVVAGGSVSGGTVTSSTIPPFSQNIPANNTPITPAPTVPPQPTAPNTTTGGFWSFIPFVGKKKETAPASVTPTTPIHAVSPSKSTKKSYDIVFTQYTLNGVLVHASGESNDGWTLDTTTLQNGTYTLNTFLHYADGRIDTGSNTFVVDNTPTLFEKVVHSIKNLFN